MSPAPPCPQTGMAVWVVANGDDTFVPFEDVIDLWEAA
jgi:hypothetical protein